MIKTLMKVIVSFGLSTIYFVLDLFCFIFEFLQLLPGHPFVYLLFCFRNNVFPFTEDCPNGMPQSSPGLIQL